MSIFAALISNRPAEAHKALEAYEESASAPWLIVCPKRHESEFKKAAKEVDATIILEETARQSYPPALQAPFAPSFGGLRNLALSYAARERKPVVFVDDDTRPLNDVFARHLRLMENESGKDTVLGRYEGHVGGSSSALLDLTHAMEKHADGRMDDAEWKAVRAERLAGLPPRQKAVVSGAGAAGGNLAIHWKRARSQPFVTLPYRVEDGTYAAMAGSAVLNPSLERAPIVLHEKKPKPDGLYQELESDLVGNVIAGFVLAKHNHAKVDVARLHADVKKGFLIDYFIEKFRKAKMEKDAALDRIADLGTRAVDIKALEKQSELAWTQWESLQAIWTDAWEHEI